MSHLVPSNLRSLPCSDRLRDRRLRRIVGLVRDIPFAYTPSLSIGDMMKLRAGSCTPKHALLHQVLTHFGISSRVVWVSLTFDTAVYPFPDGLNPIDPGELYCHTSLQVQTATGWQFLDISFDRFLSADFHLNDDLSYADKAGAFGDVVDLSVPTNVFDGDARRASLGFPATDSIDLQEKKRKLKLINKWLLEIRRPYFAEIADEFRQLEEALGGMAEADTSHSTSNVV